MEIQTEILELIALTRETQKFLYRLGELKIQVGAHEEEYVLSSLWYARSKDLIRRMNILLISLERDL